MNNDVTITDIDIPLDRMISISIKIWFATLLAVLMLALVGAVIYGMLKLIDGWHFSS